MNLSTIEPWKSFTRDHTDLPRLELGKVGGQFWAAYFDCDSQFRDAVQQCLEQIDVTKRLVELNPDKMVFVTDADGALQMQLFPFTIWF